MFFAGVLVGMGCLLLFGYIFAKREEKKTAKQLKEVEEALKEAETTVSEKEEVKNDD